VRTMNMAELVYSQKHPVAGYTCMLTDLHPSIRNCSTGGSMATFST
jgi:hypothetical protein